MSSRASRAAQEHLEAGDCIVQGAAHGAAAHLEAPDLDDRILWVGLAHQGAEAGVRLPEPLDERVGGELRETLYLRCERMTRRKRGRLARVRGAELGDEISW